MSEERNPAVSGDALKARLLVAQATKKHEDGFKLTDVSMVYEANVLALLDVAAAIRELREPVASDAPDHRDEIEGLLDQRDRVSATADSLRALLARAVRELAGSGSPGQNRLAAELARDGGIEL